MYNDKQALEDYNSGKETSTGISSNYKLSEEFIEKHKDWLDGHGIPGCQNLS